MNAADVKVLKVRGDSPVKGVAGAIAKALRVDPTVYVQAIGPVAVNQAVKDFLRRV